MKPWNASLISCSVSLTTLIFAVVAVLIGTYLYSRGIVPGICTSRTASPASVGIAPIRPLA